MQDLIDIHFITVPPWKKTQNWSIDWIFSLWNYGQKSIQLILMQEQYTACCWSTLEEETNCAKSSLFTIDSSAEMTAIHLVLLVYHWLFDLRKVQQLLICKSCCLLEEHIVPVLFLSEPHIGNTQYLLANLSGIVAVTVAYQQLLLQHIVIPKFQTGSVTLLNSSHYSYSSMQSIDWRLSHIHFCGKQFNNCPCPFEQV